MDEFRLILSQNQIIDFLQDNLEKVPFCKSDNGGGGILDPLKDAVVGTDSSWIPSIDCKNAVGYLGVYRYDEVSNIYYLINVRDTPLNFEGIKPRRIF